VFIGPGALIVGNIKIGNNVAIGGNAVVTQDISDEAVVFGNPGKIISSKGSYGYINHIDYIETFG
jgi:serine O-acetyltransferase